MSMVSNDTASIELEPRDPIPDYQSQAAPVNFLTDSTEHLLNVKSLVGLHEKYIAKTNSSKPDVNDNTSYPIQ
jgi:hypothetical protein